MRCFSYGWKTQDTTIWQGNLTLSYGDVLGIGKQPSAKSERVWYTAHRASRAIGISLSSQRGNQLLQVYLQIAKTSKVAAGLYRSTRNGKCADKRIPHRVLQSNVREGRQRVIEHHIGVYLGNGLWSFFGNSRDAFSAWRQRINRPDPDSDIRLNILEDYQVSRKRYGDWCISL